MKICISGVQGAGKTTLLSKLYSTYASQYEVYYETVRPIMNYMNKFNIYNSSLSITLDQNTSDFAQLTFLNHYWQLMQRDYDDNKVHLFDRFSLDCLICWHNHFFNHDNKIIKYSDNQLSYWDLEIMKDTSLHQCITKTLEFFDIIVFMEAGAVPLVDDGVRDISDFAMKRSKERSATLANAIKTQSLDKIKLDSNLYPEVWYFDTDFLLNHQPFYKYLHDKINNIRENR